MYEGLTKPRAYDTMFLLLSVTAKPFRVSLVKPVAYLLGWVINSYDARWKIEEVFRALHDQLGLDECASRSFVAQSAHTMFAMTAYTILASQKTGSELSVYQQHDRCMVDADYTTSLVNDFVKQGDLRSA